MSANRQGNTCAGRSVNA
ncbi:hypothetical protein [Escherichia coli]|nr:hypothetical protein [Escherichia coli]MDA2816130.1 hypothetical protein [Escherichia coli]MDA5216334.1 hypothetical protein [Escherichia coli]MDA5580342.1 hypothetical protein [Escherichia coli]